MSQSEGTSPQSAEPSPHRQAAGTQTRVDAAHVRADSAAEQSGILLEVESGLPNGSETGNPARQSLAHNLKRAEKLRSHAGQLAVQLQSQQRHLQRREANLHAQLATSENELRSQRLTLQEREQELSERENHCNE